MLAEEGEGSAYLERLYRQLTEFDDSRFQRLEEMGRGFRKDFDFDGLIASHFA